MCKTCLSLVRRGRMFMLIFFCCCFAPASSLAAFSCACSLRPMRLLRLISLVMQIFENHVEMMTILMRHRALSCFDTSFMLFGNSATDSATMPAHCDSLRAFIQTIMTIPTLSYSRSWNWLMRHTHTQPPTLPRTNEFAQLHQNNILFYQLNLLDRGDSVLVKYAKFEETIEPNCSSGRHKRRRFFVNG